MRNGPGKLVVAAAALVGVWIVTYWLWPSRPQPPITFDLAQESDSAAPSPTQPVATSSARSDAQRQSDRSGANPLGSDLEPAPMPSFKSVTPPEFTEHTVEKGETVWSLAEKYFGDRNLGMAIARANPQVDPQKLRAGMTLLIPKDPGNIQGTPIGEKSKPPAPELVQYVVQSGDTLTAIALHFYGKVSLWTRIRDANPKQINKEGTNIRPGMKLLIPPPPADISR